MLTFENIIFRFWVLAPGGVYSPSQFDVTTAGDVTTARCHGLTYGNGSGTVPGEVEVVFCRTPRGLSWKVRAALAEPVKGIKVALEPLPLGSIMVPVGQTVDLQPGEPGRVSVFPGGYAAAISMTDLPTKPSASIIAFSVAVKENSFKTMCAGLLSSGA